MGWVAEKNNVPGGHEGWKPRLWTLPSVAYVAFVSSEECGCGM